MRRPDRPAMHRETIREKRFGGREFSLVPQQHGEIPQAHGHLPMLITQHPAPNGQGFAQQRLSPIDSFERAVHPPQFHE
jgi:hypothetical protein